MSEEGCLHQSEKGFQPETPHVHFPAQMRLDTLFLQHHIFFFLMIPSSAVTLVYFVDVYTACW